MEKTLLVPTVGRVVYYNEGRKEHPTFLAAIICAALSKTCVNLMIITNSGITYGMLSIEQGSDHGQWDWMPYQKEKAAEESAT